MILSEEGKEKSSSQVLVPFTVLTAELLRTVSNGISVFFFLPYSFISSFLKEWSWSF